MSGLQCLVGGSCQKQGSAACSGFAESSDSETTWTLRAEFVSIVPVCRTLFFVLPTGQGTVPYAKLTQILLQFAP